MLNDARPRPVDYTIVDLHVDELRRRNLAEGTVYRRNQAGRRFAEWLHPRRLAEATPDDVEAFLDDRSRRTVRPIGPRTRYHWLSNLEALYRTAVRHGAADTNPVSPVIRPRLDRLLPRPISSHDLAEAIRQACPLMRAWLLCGALAGLRVAEMAGLTRADVLEADMLLRVIGKGRKERLVPLHPDLLDALRRHGLPRTGHLFVRPTGAPFTAQMVSRHVNAYLGEVGIDATAHQLRHWFGTQAYRSCRDLRTVQDLLGHASPTTTALYTATTPADARAAVETIKSPS